MKLELTFCMDNAAFDNGPGPTEAVRLLREAADRLEREGVEDGQVKRIRDVNGSNVGFWYCVEGND